MHLFPSVGKGRFLPHSIHCSLIRLKYRTLRSSLFRLWMGWNLMCNQSGLVLFGWDVPFEKKTMEWKGVERTEFRRYLTSFKSFALEYFILWLTTSWTIFCYALTYLCYAAPSNFIYKFGAYRIKILCCKFICYIIFAIAFWYCSLVVIHHWTWKPYTSEQWTFPFLFKWMLLNRWK